MSFWNVLVIIIIIIFCFTIYLCITRKEELFKNSGVPYIKPWPLVGNMGPIIMKQISMPQLFSKFYFLNTKAKYVGFFEFGTPMLIIRDPEMIKLICINNYKIFNNRRGFAENGQDIILGKDLSFLKNERWHDVRSILNPFLTSSKLNKFFEILSQKCQDFTDYVPNKKESEINVKLLFEKFAVDVIFAYACGLSVNSCTEEGEVVFGKVMQGITNEKIEKLKHFLIQCPFIWKILGMKFLSDQTIKFIKNIIYNRISERENRKDNSTSNMIDTMIDIPDNVEKLSMEEMIAQVFVMIGGSFQMISESLTSLCYDLAVNPNVQKILQKEIDSLLNSNTRISTSNSRKNCSVSRRVKLEDIMNLKFFDAVVKESLRLHSPLTFLERISSQVFQLPPALPGSKSFIVKPGMLLIIPMEAIQRDSKYFSAPDVFNPYRFYNMNNKNISNSYTYFPFGLGQRHCIANRFSLQILKVVLFYILARNHRFNGPIPLKMTEGMFTKMSKEHIILRIVERINCETNK